MIPFTVDTGVRFAPKSVLDVQESVQSDSSEIQWGGPFSNPCNKSEEENSHAFLPGLTSCSQQF